MKENITVDSDVIFKYLKTGEGSLPVAHEQYTLLISTTTYTELLASKTFEDKELESEVLEFIEKYFTVYECNSIVALETAKILRNSELTLAAASVAATALVSETKLLTDNKKEFEKIEGIEFVEIEETK